MTKSDIGRREFNRVTGGAGLPAADRVGEVSPLLKDAITGFTFGELFTRGGLSRREREMITVAVLAAIGGTENQLGLHLPAALECGADPDELMIICEQLAPYAGFPRALNAVRSVRAVTEQRGGELPLPSHKFAVSGHETLACDVYGDGGDPLLLIHTMGLDHLVWRDFIRAVGGRRRVIAYDLRGHGGATGAPPARDIEQLAADGINLLDRFDVGAAEVVALGTGAAVATALAEREPERITRLSLIAALPGLTPDECAGWAEAGADPDSGIEWLVRSFLPRWFSPEELADNRWGVRYVRDRLERIAGAEWESSWRALESAPPLLPTLGQLTQPVRLIVGERDAVSTPEAAEDAVGGLANIELVRIADCSRLVPLVAADELAQIIAPAAPAPPVVAATADDPMGSWV